ncbi:NAD-dependent malic enzyme [Streptomyces sp. NBC_01264]|uniref:NAD-dependent malic enzyme n=1 Tax=Streptomyces sp. NBC_01264 TaxID=2903804 RepID=UPI002254CEFF|nr:NAD-dependent malic enzyme [Streptomyces sp. NBC_01264]MCX4781660.1 NAD-dependent malic enzyme [Streptomyces sp. NBC_01264]
MAAIPARSGTGASPPVTRWNPDSQEWETTARGHEVLADPRLSKGTAFTAAERAALGLTGLLPPAVLTLDEQVLRAYGQFGELPDDINKNAYLTALQDRNEVLFHRLLLDHLAEMLPIVYTPTVGLAIEHYSHEYRTPRGVYLSVDAPEDVERALAACGRGPDEIDLIVATDAQAILGIGDWGVGGIDIAVGKLTVYTAAAGIDPARTLAVMLDVGTDRRELLDDPLYLGNRHPRETADAYDAFIDRYVTAAGTLFPNALLHWEDFAAPTARRILDRYRASLFTFNDDMQGTGAVNLAAVLAGARASGTPLVEQRIVIFGSGTAGIGIADQLCAAMTAGGLDTDAAQARFWCLDRPGLLTTAVADLRDFQLPYARPAGEVEHWEGAGTPAGIPLAEVVRQVHPTILIGTSAQTGAFTEQIVREMAAHVDRPVILPMSNPTSLSEATPQELITWTDGRALVASGSPFGPVTHQGVTYAIGQANNALVFPGLGLGAFVAGANRITDGMIAAAARAVATRTDTSGRGAPLLPLVDDLRATSEEVALAVASAAAEDGVARHTTVTRADVKRAMWWPHYHPVRAM